MSWLSNLFSKITRPVAAVIGSGLEKGARLFGRVAGRAGEFVKSIPVIGDAAEQFGRASGLTGMTDAVKAAGIGVGNVLQQYGAGQANLGQVRDVIGQHAVELAPVRRYFQR